MQFSIMVGKILFAKIIADNLTLEEANTLEDELILKYNSIEEGFNLNRGGRNRLWTEEQRE